MRYAGGKALGLLHCALYDLLLAWQPGQASALDTRAIARGRDVETVTGQEKDASGSLTGVVYHVTFAFVFHAFHPGKAITLK